MWRALRRTLVIAGVLVFADAFVLNQGVIALVTALGGLIGGVPRALLAWRSGKPTTARLRAARLFHSSTLSVTTGVQARFTRVLALSERQPERPRCRQ